LFDQCLTRIVWKVRVERRIGDTEMHDLADSCFSGGLDQRARICDGLVECRAAMIESHPICVVKNRSASQRSNQTCAIAKIHRSNFNLIPEAVRAFRMTGDSADSPAGV